MPQLNPEFFVSQLFWLMITFVFLLVFLSNVSLPRIGSVLKKREKKINDDIATAKKLQAEAEVIQKKIEDRLRNALNERNSNLQDQNSSMLQQLSPDMDGMNPPLGGSPF